MEAMLAEAERNVGTEGHLPWLVIGGTRDQRLAVRRHDMDPEDCARVAERLLAEPDVLWVAIAGEAALPSGMGVLRHVFVRRHSPGGAWDAAVRPFLAADEVVWLGGWARHSGEGREAGALKAIFPVPSKSWVRFLDEDEDLVEPSAVQDVPAGATTQDIARMAGLLMESFFVSHGFVPPSVVRYDGARLEIRMLPRSSSPNAAPDLAIRLAQEEDTEAVGLFKRTNDTEVQPPAEQVHLRIEFRGGPVLVWKRRFRIVGQNRARWLDPGGEISSDETLARRWLPG
jgi:hypothetical protein